jgi:hypothetical protein
MGSPVVTLLWAFHTYIIIDSIHFRLKYANKNKDKQWQHLKFEHAITQNLGVHYGGMAYILYF